MNVGGWYIAVQWDFDCWAFGYTDFFLLLGVKILALGPLMLVLTQISANQSQAAAPGGLPAAGALIEA